MPSEATNWVVLTVVQGQLEENQLRAFLEAHGVPTQVKGEALRNTHGLTVDGLGAVEIFVRRQDAAGARQLLASVERGELTLSDSDPEPESTS